MDLMDGAHWHHRTPFAHLLTPHSEIKASFFQQFIVATTFCDAAPFQNVNAIGMQNG